MFEIWYSNEYGEDNLCASFESAEAAIEYWHENGYSYDDGYCGGYYLFDRGNGFEILVN